MGEADVREQCSSATPAPPFPTPALGWIPTPASPGSETRQQTYVLFKMISIQDLEQPYVKHKNRTMRARRGNSGPDPAREKGKGAGAAG